MTERSMHAGQSPTVIVKGGASVSVRGQETKLVRASTSDRWGLKIEKHSEREIGRARAAIGENVLFDVRLKRPKREPDGREQEVIEVQFGGNGELVVPLDSDVKVYAGEDIHVEGMRGIVDAYAGRHIRLLDVRCLGNASAGGSMDLACETMLGTNVEFKAGRELRFAIQDLDNAILQVRDLGGYWEARIGSGEKRVSLKCGGDVTLVTRQKVEALPPNYVLGKIEKPSTS